MNKSPTVRLVLALTFLLAILAFGSSGSARTSHIRSGQAQEGQVHFFVQEPAFKEGDLEVFEGVEGAKVELSTPDRANCRTDEDGKCDLLVPYGKYELTISKEGYDTVTESDFEVNKPEQRHDKTIRKSNGSLSPLMSKE